MKLTRENITVPAKPIRIVQFGEGNFLRAFINWMIQEMNEKANFDAGVAVVQPIPQGLGELVNAQDGLYHLYLKGIEKGELINKRQLIDCIQKVINPYENYQDYLDLAKEDSLQFVFSNTTEAGISYNENDTLEHIQNSFPTKLTALLYQRFSHFNGDEKKGLTILPCELIDKNGQTLKEIILKHATDWELSAAFKSWINSACTFYNTLVDRIVPGFPKDRIEEIHEELGYEDQLVVEGEQFHLFVIEGDSKIKDILPTEEVGLNVIVTNNQAPYRSRKVRILNGAHTCLVPLGLLSGLETVKEGVDDKEVGSFLESIIKNEIVPSLPASEGIEEFANDVLDRFRNPFIKHYLKSISLNSFPKFNTRVLPSIVSFHQKNGSFPQGILTSFASLIKLYDPKNLKEFKPQDNQEIIDLLANLWADFYINGSTDFEIIIEGVLSATYIWGQNLNELEGLQIQLSQNLKQIHNEGISSLIEEKFSLS
ncbi:tagaturonate reductase [Sediminitomix flava]|uniref:Tagaturonate reductase n=1 Tax=Sediminitomix flava TaxID=379075 RepID=A0A315Z498_SEDFL|nr:tagaturonate reductase [Sediminitomix flava]PWJ37909.1 tagaturonate reductase [Sediminitomix flava]